MENDPELRIKLVKQLQVQFLMGVRKGEFLCDVFNPFLERANVPVRMTKGFSEEILRAPELTDLMDKPVKKEILQAKSLF
jgi:hypothetical protein